MKSRHHITTIRPRRNSLVLAATLFFSGLLSSCSPTRFFYYPNRKLYVDPDRIGIKCELVRYKSKNGRELVGLWFESPEPPIGTIVHFHGNFGNVSSHFLCAQFLTRYGFDVLVFDYQGYGGSEGKPSPRNTIEDGEASIDYALSRDRGRRKSVAVFGQSLGGAVATVVSAQDTRVNSAVLEAAFNSYRGMAFDVLGRSAWTWLLYPIAPWFVGTKYDPEKWIAKISPRPVLLIHGDADTVVPPWTSERLYERAQEPKRLWIVKDANHLQCRSQAGEDYDKTIADFFRAAFGSSQHQTGVSGP
jgi:fermentation-respiration switch protein FrsA (DUF1100 family)